MSAVEAAAVEPLEEHAEWSALGLEDPSAWTWALDDAEVAELVAALEVARCRHDDLLDVTRDDFPLPSLAARLLELERELVDGRGFARITGIPVDELGYEGASWVYWGMGLHLGDPWPQNARGHLLGDVRDQGKAPDDPTARGNEIGGAPLTFHSDGSDLVGLLCLHPGVSGGESVIADVLAAHNELARTRPDLCAALYEPLPYDFRGEQADGARPYYTVPVFTRHGDRLFVRYIRPFIEASQRHADAPPITDVQREAMDALDAIVARPELQVEMRFAPGDVQWINNYHVLHGRRRYADDPATGAVRHLKRLWLATDVLGPDDRPDRFQRAGAAAHWGSRRTRA